MSDWDEHSGLDLNIEVALDARGAARQIEHLRRYRAAFADAEQRIHARRDHLHLQIAALAHAEPRDLVRIERLDSEIEGLRTALVLLDHSLQEAMDPHD